ncbi:MAG: cytochrome c [Planctomycetota bacterium]|nr:MAG: cytochrome c [Planctomycetota bacterium]
MACSQCKLPTWFFGALLLLGVGTLIPFAFIARARHNRTTKPRIHIIHDMDNQPRFKQQQQNPLFPDGRAMRPPVPGTVARGELRIDTHLHTGRVNGTFVDAFPARDEAGRPFVLDEAFFARGEKNFRIFCAVCHGESGYGDGPVERRVLLLKKRGLPDVSGWASPANYHTDALRALSVGELFHVISYGRKNMAGYRAQIPLRDRWAIAFYVKALQHSQRPE